MSVTTHHICDRCQKVVPPSKIDRIVLSTKGSYAHVYNSPTTLREVDLCDDCQREIGLTPYMEQQRAEHAAKNGLPEPAPVTIDDLVREIVRDEASYQER